MSIDISSLSGYVNQVGLRLEGFKQQRANVWNARCPICGDSERNSSKRRFYIHADKDKTTLMATCHNCQYANGFENFMRDHHNDIYQSMIFDLFKRGKTSERRKVNEAPTQTQQIPVEVQEEASTPVLQLQMLDTLPEDHPAVLYVASRRIFKYAYKFLSYCENLKRDVAAHLPTYDTEESNIPEDERLLIPFYDKTGRMTFIQARAMDPHAAIRYITLRIDETAEKWYGVDRLKPDMKTYVLEGPIDSTFIPNCVATADANLLSYPDGDIYIPDNQYRNKSIAAMVERIIDADKSVVLFPAWFTHKDINDAIKSGMTVQDLYQVIKEHTFSGMRARLEWTTRSRVSTAQKQYQPRSSR